MVQKCFNSLNLHLLLEMGGRFLKGIISGNLNLYVYNLLMKYNLTKSTMDGFKRTRPKNRKYVRLKPKSLSIELFEDGFKNHRFLISIYFLILSLFSLRHYFIFLHYNVIPH